MTAGQSLCSTATLALSIIVSPAFAAEQCSLRVVGVRPSIEAMMVHIEYQLVDTSGDDEMIDSTRDAFVEFVGQVTVALPGGGQMEMPLSANDRVLLSPGDKTVDGSTQASVFYGEIVGIRRVAGRLAACFVK